ncbi:hypothetical protein WKI68_01525 [Streptomyces sp. MS1.HAVA.3]|uniref:THUMP-like domain-containing protein n=1 Tax=Streptomyces caledonius TaxID=3134107 RepID=A0ABU8TXX8_9ACTN
MPSGMSLTGRDLPEPAVRPVGRSLYAPDPAVVHARLVAEVAQDVGGGPLDGGGALLTADELRHTPFATAYEVTDVLPFTTAALKATLREHAVGRVTVAAQNLGIEPNEFLLDHDLDLDRDLDPQDSDAATVFITGTADADRPTMLIATPCPATHEP